MRYIISESRLSAIMIKFLDDYLSKYEVIEAKDILSWGTGQDNQMVYDKDNELLFVRESLYQLIRDVFGVEHHDYVEFIKSYMSNMGYFVKRIV
jgi:hypothetical protein